MFAGSKMTSRVMNDGLRDCRFRSGSEMMTGSVDGHNMVRLGGHAAEQIIDALAPGQHESA